jgi:aspartyl-tRNA synthetase
MRRERLKHNIILRAKVTKAMRDFYNSKGFIEIETPYLGRSTPEGARDFLVPSRLHPRKFYALTQSPQLFKQLLMISGFERYYQVARCFRDEDPRADRQPEFTQFDMEMSFVSREDVMKTVEESMKYVFKEVVGVDLPTPFPRLTFEEAIKKYGTDKPDLRFGSELYTIEGREAQGDNAVRGFKMPGLHKACDEIPNLLSSITKEYEVNLLAVYVLNPEGKPCTYGNIEGLEKWISELNLIAGEGVIFAAGEYMNVSQALGTLRNYLGRLLGLADPRDYRFVWVTDFPLFETDPETGELLPKHHPFTSPRPEDVDILDTDPTRAKALSYDLVLNGYEVAGGSIRIHKRELQEKIFKLLGLTREEMLNRYGFLLEALEYGAPPHGGIAFGLDRLVAVIAGEESIREVIAFPKNKEMVDPMTGSPAEAPPEYLKDLHWLKIE